MTDDHAELMTKLAMSLDTCLDLIDAQARKEARAGEGMRLRPITWQQRAESARKLVDEARASLEAAGKRVWF